ncbi:MAG TPA: glycosyltransferase [Solirubrobacterales bacterium]
MRVIALIAAYNERRFIDPCLRQLAEHGIEAYLIDNCSTDNTVELAEAWLGRGLIDIESFPRGDGDRYVWRSLLERKEELSRELDADWFIHLDPDEIRLPPSRGQTLERALATVDGAGFNAVNFNEFTFLPTREAPDHDHGDFQRTLRTYYPFAPRSNHQLKAWKANPSAEIAWSGGHEVRFERLRMYPESFPMKHYLFLSVPHAIEKYVQKRYDPEEVESGWHGWRSEISASDIRLPRRAELRIEQPGEELDSTEPHTKHYIAEPQWR